MKNYQKELKNLKNKGIMKNLLLTILIILSFLGCGDRAETIALIRLKFEGFVNSDKARVTIIETMRNDTSIYLDTFAYRTVLSKTNGYQIGLELKKEVQNGDYIIITDSINEVNVISNVEVNKDVTFTYFFNGIAKTEKNRYLYITRKK